MSQGFPRTSSHKTLLFAEIPHVFGHRPTGPTLAPCGVAKPGQPGGEPAQTTPQFAACGDRRGTRKGGAAVSAENAPVNPNRLTVDQAARLLSAASPRPVTVAMLRADVDAGAPTNADGTINLVHYAAWLAREMGRSAGERHGD